MMSPHYHGVTFWDAGMMLGVSERTVRSWFSRYPDLRQARTGDGQIDVMVLQEWYDNVRDWKQAGRRGNAGVKAKPRTRRVAS